MKRMRWNIAWRMGLGFGVFILAVAVLFVFTRLTLTRSSELAAEVDSALVPSLEALEDMDQTLASSLVYINNWIAEQSRADVEKKVMLRKSVNATFPQHLKALDGLDLAWTPRARAHLDTLRVETDALLVLYGEIMRLLPDWKSYQDYEARFKAKEYAEPGAQLEVFSTRVQNRLAALTAGQNAALRDRTARMEELGAELTMYAGRVAWIVVVLGIALGIIVTRSIVQPVKELKRALLHMGRGVLPDRDVRVTPDEIGDMATAESPCRRGCSGPKILSGSRGGDFETPYEPLSDDDAWARRFQMRTSLAENERELRARWAGPKSWPSKRRMRRKFWATCRTAFMPCTFSKPSFLGAGTALVYDSAVFYQPETWSLATFIGSIRGQPSHVCGHRLHGPWGARGVPEFGGHNALDRVTKVYTEPQSADKLNEHV